MKFFKPSKTQWDNGDGNQVYQMHTFWNSDIFKYNSVLNLSLSSESGCNGWDHWLAIIFPYEKQDVWELSQCQGLCIQNGEKSVLGMKYSGNAGLFCTELEAGYRTMLPYVTTIFLVWFYLFIIQ